MDSSEHNCLVPQVQMTQAVTIFSGQSVISRVYTSRFGNGTVRLEPRPRWYKKPKVSRTEPYRAIPCSGKAPLVKWFSMCVVRVPLAVLRPPSSGTRRVINENMLAETFTTM